MLFGREKIGEIDYTGKDGDLPIGKADRGSVRKREAVLYSYIGGLNNGYRS